MGEAEFIREWPGGESDERLQEIINSDKKKTKLKGDCRKDDIQREMTITDVIDDADQAIILGEAGSGKTTLLKHLLSRNNEFKRGYIPIFLTFRHWLKSKFGDPIDAFVDQLSNLQPSIDIDCFPVLKKEPVSYTHLRAHET